MSAPPVALEWVPREPPLVPAAIMMRDDVRPLLAALRSRGPAAGRLRAVAGVGRLVVLGETDDLPWVGGARYLGWDGGILLPTEVRPVLPVDVLRAAAQGRRPGAAPLLAALPDALVFAETPTQPVDLLALEARFPS